MLAHLIKFAAALQSNFAGAIGWDAVNIFFAPYMEGMSDDDVKQLAQMLIFEFSQQAVARGGQAIFSDINIYWECRSILWMFLPSDRAESLRARPTAIMRKKDRGSPGSFSRSSRKATAQEGLSSSPSRLFILRRNFSAPTDHMDFLDLICDVAADKGNTYFVFDRGDTAKISECCRLSFKLDEHDLLDAKEPWRMRYCALQNVSINLPRIAYLAGTTIPSSLTSSPSGSCSP